MEAGKRRRKRKKDREREGEREIWVSKHTQTLWIFCKDTNPITKAFTFVTLFI
jgi:hypothetical protein